jgi:hypothetical protein
MARIAQGALVDVGPLGLQPRALVFELNPNRIIRRLERATRGRTVERIHLRVPFDATIALEQPDLSPDAVRHGVRPQLAALQRMAGLSSPVLFVWGDRTVAVRIDALDIREHFFDANLNPIRATARIDLRVIREAPGFFTRWLAQIQQSDNEQIDTLARRALVPAQFDER